jgi:hypothetical protein
MGNQHRPKSPRSLDTVSARMRDLGERRVCCLVMELRRISLMFNAGEKMTKGLLRGERTRVLWPPSLSLSLPSASRAHPTRSMSPLSAANSEGETKPSGLPGSSVSPSSDDQAASQRSAPAYARDERYYCEEMVILVRIDICVK